MNSVNKTCCSDLKFFVCAVEVCVCDDWYVLFSPCAEEPKKKEEMMQKFHDFETKAETYYIYHTIYRHVVRVTGILGSHSLLETAWCL